MRPERLSRLVLKQIITSQSQKCMNYKVVKLYSSSSSVKPSSFTMKINEETDLIQSRLNQTVHINENQKSILLEKYDELLKSNKFQYDRKQFETLFFLSSFYRQIINYEPPESNSWTNSKFKKFFNQFLKSTDSDVDHMPKIKSIYLYGGVGCGKTMMMDLIYNSIPDTKLKQRIHFNKFMLNIHQSIHEIKQMNEHKNDDPIQIVCDQLIKKVHLLFFDEFQVTDIADAMLMSRLFTNLFQRGMIVFFTSNRVPTDLYKNGLNREIFTPFIDHIKQVCHIIHLESTIDYRKISLKSTNQVYFNSDYESRRLDELIKSYLPEGVNLHPKKIDVMGREVILEHTYKNILVTNYSFICQEARGSVDYLELCKNFDCIIMKDIPFIDMKNGDSLRRFITFIDALYDNNIRFICSGKASSPQYLFDLEQREQPGEHTTKLQDEYFAIDRTISRLIDMQSDAYLSKKQNF
ncbi:unnamed protein product [Brachionus calyciflorus]|uniref:Uncharacterized protein n=1 Tax=Brachionus calyciflorus TaxID=104777 RepID=A0A814BIW6_9BILA|nr:unnamed protein product [Brachionus calyciflorus]